MVSVLVFTSSLSLNLGVASKSIQIIGSDTCYFFCINIHGSPENFFNSSGWDNFSSKTVSLYVLFVLFIVHFIGTT